MQKTKSHSFVIFPSSVRSIPFTVPVLPSSCSSTHCRLDDDDGNSCSPSLCSSCSRRGYQSPFQRAQSPLSSSTSTVPSLPCSEHSPPDETTGERSAERWASEPCCLEVSPMDNKRSLLAGNNNTLRRTNYKVSCDSIASQRTIDLENANLLCGIDPSLYLSTESGIDGGSIGCGGEAEDDDFDSGVYDESNIGRVWFGLEYDPETERLLVSLIRIRNLPSSLIASHSARDPVVRIWLMPDERRWVQAKFKRKTCNPRFNENFAFQVSVRDFAQRSIKLTVFGSGDRHNRRQVAFGQVIYPLRDHVYEPNERIIIWRDLERESTMLQKTNEDVQLYMSLSYNSQLSRLSVAVHSGKNFPPSEEHDRPSNEFYVVVSQMEMSKAVKKKKTSIVKQCINFCPIFNDLFHFKVRSTSLDVTSLLVTAMRHIAGHKDRLIGRLVLGSFMFARGPELDHWNAMLANEKEQISRWHTLTN